MWIVPKSESNPFRKEVQDKLNDGRFTRTGVVSLNYIFRWEETPEGFDYWRTAYNLIKTIKWEDAPQEMADFQMDNMDLFMAEDEMMGI